MGGRSGEDALIPVHVTPRASQDMIGPWRADRLEVRTIAPPADGRANEALCRLLADALDVALSRVKVVQGARGRTKAVQVVGLPASEILRRLGHPGSTQR